MISPHTKPTSYLDELRRIVPTEQIEPQIDTADDGGAWAVEPATQIELVEVLKWANGRHAAVFTRRPRRHDADLLGRRPRIYLRGRRMKRVKDLDIVSGTVTVQSGITMSELHRILEERSFTTGFPTRPWRQESIGSVLAAALDAHWGPRYGSMEDQVLSLGVVFPDGSVAGGRGAPRKAVGPDFDRLFLGSRGRYGIIYEATLRIYPSATRVAMSYAAPDLTTALEAVRGGIALGLDPRAIELLTPAPDRAWGRKRVGLTDDRPVLVIVEPWGPLAGRPVAWIDNHFATTLERLEPPLGWNMHEGLLPAPRAWAEPVVGVRWARLLELAQQLGRDVPPGLWVVRMSRHGGWLSLASGVDGPSAEIVRALVQELRPAGPLPWERFEDGLKRELDPKDILNPTGT
ncbi:MAG: FAD-binding oxidoreductase [Deltaproteobacteria bacterium]|nr:MAG: FAD-binding oxidoreductase [Deltaproteobacteria bacterium]